MPHTTLNGIQPRLRSATLKDEPTFLKLKFPIQCQLDGTFEAQRLKDAKLITDKNILDI